MRAFSPDGRRLVYQRVADGFGKLFVMDMASRREQQLTLSPSDKYQAEWSRDGRWVAFSANTDGMVQVWRIPAAGGKEERLTTGDERMLHFFYSPDGRWLYVQPSHRNIHRMPSDGGPLQQVTRFPESGLFLEEPTITRGPLGAESDLTCDAVLFVASRCLRGVQPVRLSCHEVGHRRFRWTGVKLWSSGSRMNDRQVSQVPTAPALHLAHSAPHSVAELNFREQPAPFTPARVKAALALQSAS